MAKKNIQDMFIGDIYRPDYYIEYTQHIPEMSSNTNAAKLVNSDELNHDQFQIYLFRPSGWREV